MLLDWQTISLIVSVFLLAGAVKGVVGLGLPTVSLGLLTATFDLTTAMTLMIVPSLITNIWQACSGGNALWLIKRTWPFLLLATIAVWPGSRLLVTIELSYLSIALGVILLVYAATGLVGLRITVQPAHRMRAGYLFGGVNGILTGMNGSFVVPGVLYLQALGLSRHQLVQAMGMLFTLSTLALIVSLGSHNLLTNKLGLISTAAVLPALIGMLFGQSIRRQLSEDVFRRVFYTALLFLGMYIGITNLFR